jgi:hypothetical protein
MVKLEEVVDEDLQKSQEGPVGGEDDWEDSEDGTSPLPPPLITMVVMGGSLNFVMDSLLNLMTRWSDVVVIFNISIIARPCSPAGAFLDLHTHLPQSTHP